MGFDSTQAPALYFGALFTIACHVLFYFKYCKGRRDRTPEALPAAGALTGEKASSGQEAVAVPV